MELKKSFRTASPDEQLSRWYKAAFKVFLNFLFYKYFASSFLLPREIMAVLHYY